jgi:hypothetical protein
LSLFAPSAAPSQPPDAKTGSISNCSGLLAQPQRNGAVTGCPFTNHSDQIKYQEYCDTNQVDPQKPISIPLFDLSFNFIILHT